MLPKGKKTLFIKASFANIVMPYMALGIPEMTAIDPRFCPGAIYDYIERVKPDTVVFLFKEGFILWGKL